jgi:YHS domain-containing protein
MFFTKKKVKDPVCGMEVKVNDSTLRCQFQGKEYYFCSSSCRTSFEKEPQRYISSTKEGGCCGGHTDNGKHDQEHKHLAHCNGRHEHAHKCCGNHSHH